MLGFIPSKHCKKKRIHQIHTSNALVKVCLYICYKFNEHISWNNYDKRRNNKAIIKTAATVEVVVATTKKSVSNVSIVFCVPNNAIIGNVWRHHFVFLVVWMFLLFLKTKRRKKNSRKMKSPWLVLFVILSDRKWIKWNGFALKSRRKYADDTNIHTTLQTHFSTAFHNRWNKNSNNNNGFETQFLTSVFITHIFFKFLNIMWI